MNDLSKKLLSECRLLDLGCLDGIFSFEFALHGDNASTGTGELSLQSGATPVKSRRPLTLMVCRRIAGALSVLRP